MFQNIGFTEILLIGIVALLLFGPQKLPEIGRVIGKTLNDFKKGARELMEDVKSEPPTRTIQQPIGVEDSLPSTDAAEKPVVAMASSHEENTDAQGPAPTRPAERRLPD
jgi:sec-independent protein translocase protein TatA